MVIRPLEAGEWPQLKAMVKRASEELARYGTPDFSDSIVYLLHGALSGGQVVFVAEDRGKLVGYCGWVRCEGMPAGMVSGLGRYVDPDYRRQGIDRKLQLEARAHWKDQGYAAVRGSVAFGNDAGRAAAEDLGWRSVAYEIELAL